MHRQNTCICLSHKHFSSAMSQGERARELSVIRLANMQKKRREQLVFYFSSMLDRYELSRSMERRFFSYLVLCQRWRSICNRGSLEIPSLPLQVPLGNCHLDVVSISILNVSLSLSHVIVHFRRCSSHYLLITSAHMQAIELCCSSACSWGDRFLSIHLLMYFDETTRVLWLRLHFFCVCVRLSVCFVFFSWWEGKVKWPFSFPSLQWNGYVILLPSFFFCYNKRQTF